MSSTTNQKVLRLSGLDWKPLPYMRRAMKWLLEHPVSGLFLDPGLRKTSITLGAFKVMQQKGAVSRMLVVAPLKVCYNVWPSEITKWKDFQHFKCHILHGAGKDESYLDDDTIDIYLINAEGLEWLLGRKVGDKIEPNFARFKKLDCQWFVLDESSKFKNTQTKRFKLLRPFLPKFERRTILTGSPRPKSLLDLFGQVYIMDLGRSLGQYITHFRNKYFNSTGYGGYTWEIKPGAELLIQKAVKPYILRMEARDYIDMPELVEVPRFVDLPPDARAIYKEMEDELFLILEGGTALSAPTAAAARGKCAQIANGAIYKNRDGLEVRGKMDFIDIHDEKLDDLEEFLAERNGQPTLVLYYYQHDLIRIRKRLGNLPSISEVSAVKGKAMEDSWNRGEIPVLLAQPASVGHGLNMQEGQANHLYWYTLPDNYDDYDQTNRRLMRSGNKNSHVFAHRCIARKTVDEAKVALLAHKQAGQDRFLAAMKDYRRPTTRSKK